jgi:hypothetical protein
MSNDCCAISDLVDISGMMHAGIGPTHVNALLTSINIPPVTEHTLISRQAEAGPAIESVARESCIDQSQEEKLAELEALGMSQQDLANMDYLDIAVSYDMMWLKRGRAMNSYRYPKFYYFCYIQRLFSRLF